MHVSKYVSMCVCRVDSSTSSSSSSSSSSRANECMYVVGAEDCSFVLVCRVDINIGR
jgi:hypothetical protein